MRVSSLFLLPLLFATGSITFSTAVHEQAPDIRSSANMGINDQGRSEVRSVKADSMYFEVIGGETLIFALPDSLSGASVESWALMNPPALSRLSERSFLWRTRRQDRGMHSLKFEGTSTINVDNYAVARVEEWTANVRIR